MFQIICEFECTITDTQFRDVIFQVIVENDIYERFDTSHEYWEKFNARKPELKKRLGYFEIENVDNPCQVVNPKEYYEHFGNFSCNKKRKGKKKHSRHVF